MEFRDVLAVAAFIAALILALHGLGLFSFAARRARRQARRSTQGDRCLSDPHESPAHALDVSGCVDLLHDSADSLRRRVVVDSAEELLEVRFEVRVRSSARATRLPNRG
jgi:hypothetical protein